MADRFFVGDTDDDWNDANNWSGSSGGAGGVGVPTFLDDAKFDANSPTCDVDVAAECLTLDCTGFTNSLNSAGSFTITVRGSATLVAAMTLSSNVDWIIENASATFTHASKTLGAVIFRNSGASNITITLASGTFSVSQTFDINATSTGDLEIDANTNNPTGDVTGVFDIDETSTGEVTFSLGSGTWTFRTTVDFRDATTINHNSGTVVLSADSGTLTASIGNHTLNNVTVQNTGATNRVIALGGSGTNPIIAGVFTVSIESTGNLTLTNSATSITLTGSHVITKLSSGTHAWTPSNTWNFETGTLDFGDIDTFTPGSSAFHFQDATFSVDFANLIYNVIRVRNNTASNITITTTGGNGIGGGSFELENNSTGNLIFDCSVDNADYTVSAIVGDKNSSGTIRWDAGSGTWRYAATSTFAGIETFNHNNGTFKLESSSNSSFHTRGTGNMTFFNFIIEYTSTTTSIPQIDPDNTTGNSVAPPNTFKVANDLTFSELSTGTLTISCEGSDADFEVGNDVLTINASGTLELRLGAGEWRISGNCDFSAVDSIADANNASDGTLTFEGSGVQTFTTNGLDSTLLSGNGEAIKVTNGSAVVTINDGGTWTDLIADATAAEINIEFEASVTINLAALSLTGSNPRVVLRSTITDTQWGLNASSPQSVDFVDVKDSDASPGSTITASSSSNGGNNLNWIIQTNKATFIVYDYDKAPVTKTTTIVYDYLKPQIINRQLIVYDYKGRQNTATPIVYDYRRLYASATPIVYDYSGKARSLTTIVYDYIPFEPDNVRIILNPYSQDSYRLNWSGFVPPESYGDDFFYAIYIDGEPYEVDIDPDQTWMDVNGLVNLEDIRIDVVIQSFFGQRFEFDFFDIGDRVKILFKESDDPNISRYVFYGDNGTGTIDFTKEIGEIEVAQSEKDINSSFVPEGS